MIGGGNMARGVWNQQHEGRHQQHQHQHQHQQYPCLPPPQPPPPPSSSNPKLDLFVKPLPEPPTSLRTIAIPAYGSDNNYNDEHVGPLPNSPWKPRSRQQHPIRVLFFCDEEFDPQWDAQVAPPRRDDFREDVRSAVVDTRFSPFGHNRMMSSYIELTSTLSLIVAAIPGIPNDGFAGEIVRFVYFRESSFEAQWRELMSEPRRNDWHDLAVSTDLELRECTLPAHINFTVARATPRLAFVFVILPGASPQSNEMKN
jgi:hypothetical protein